ncbi:hypothetical protein [Aureimonas leprariae]|uniref:Uncharacterized protein n=1 Tax=Plantimonas leprariae TaxID=2615207 RepID=A0A7V7PLL4_9HYPH|nr:hypothetical protein [Aureimonas leprariae]KAB0677343.1 hypothetical protein F6X38_18280 [Aureimonas leprariae]
MTHDIYEDAARALVGFDGKPGADRPRIATADRLMRIAEQVEGGIASGAAALRDALVRGLAMAACTYAAIPFELLGETPDRR